MCQENDLNVHMSKTRGSVRLWRSANISLYNLSFHQKILPSSVPVPVSSLAELSFSLISASDPPPKILVLVVEIDNIRLVVASW